MIGRLYTIGVYGKTEDEFFRAILQAKIDIFCDIRRRRGVRGSQYSFVNSTYLQRALAERGIAYRYFPDLAPSKELREKQHALDQQEGVLKRTRQELGAAFKNGYMTDVLARFNAQVFCQSLGPGAPNVVLFCVESKPAACHRALLAEQLRSDLGIAVEHL